MSIGNYMESHTPKKKPPPSPTQRSIAAKKAKPTSSPLVTNFFKAVSQARKPSVFLFDTPEAKTTPAKNSGTSSSSSSSSGYSSSNNSNSNYSNNNNSSKKNNNSSR